MSFTTADPTAVLSINSNVKIEIQFRHPPFTGPDAQDIRTAIDSASSIMTSGASQSILTSVTPGLAEWEVTGVTIQPVSVTTLRQQITDSLSNQWNIFSVYVNDVQIEGFSFPQPSTQTAVSLAAIAILAIIGFYLLWRLRVI